MDGELLATDRRGTREDNCVLALFRLQELEHRPVVEQGVVVVHALGIGAVVPDDIRRNTLAKVRLEAVDAHVQKAFQVAAIPRGGIGIGEIDEGHAWLPVVPLPDVTIRALEQVSLVATFGEER